MSFSNKLSFKSRYSLPPLISLAALICLGLWLGCDSMVLTSYYAEGAVATSAPIASEAGLAVLESGGNAVDAAVAIGFTLAVVHPQAGNIGGGGFALVRDEASGEISSLDFRERAPALASERMYLDSTGEVIKNLSTVGGLAVGVPGTVAGLHALWKKFGSLPWVDLVRPAAVLADTGFLIDQYLQDHLQAYASELSEFPSTKAWLESSEGGLPKAGQRFRQHALGRTLAAIAMGGPKAFYQGQCAELIVATVAAEGGKITLEDLADYRPLWRKPISFVFDSLQIYCMAPPSSGGIVLGQLLKLLEPYDLSSIGPDSPEYAHLFAEAARLAFADRSIHLGDPDYWAVPPKLLDEAYLDNRRQLIKLETASSSEQIGPGHPLRAESDETTHFSVCDGEGNVVSLTYTLNDSYGSKLMVEGAGFLLNNEMDDFSSKPGHPNLYGLVGAEANKIEPGKRMLSSMSPTIVMREGQPYIVIGSRGGSKIITAVAQTILNLTRFGMSPLEAVSRPHFHHQWLPDQISLEKGGFDVAFQQTLIRYGHYLKERDSYGDLQLICLDRAGLMAPISDPRERGLGLGF